MSNKGINYEAFMMDELIMSRRNAWIVAAVSWLVTVISLSTLAFLMPLKTVVPYVIKENVTTGETRIITALDQRTLKTDEATDKFFAGDYVKKREQYYYDILTKDYYQVLLYSNLSTQKDYQAIYAGDKSRDKILGNKYKVETTIISVVLSESSGSKIATVRSSSVTIDIASKIKSDQTYNVSTISYEYDSSKIMKEEDRMINPLGFTVLTYRKDREITQ
jgi:type IV secretion system protein VirB8